MADGHKEGKKSSPCPQRSEQGDGKVGLISSKPSAAPRATGVERGQTWGREIRTASCSIGLEGGRMIDKAQCAHLLYDLVSRSNHKPEILFHLPSRD